MMILLAAVAAAFALFLTLGLRIVVRLALGLRPDRATLRPLGIAALATIILLAAYVIAVYAQM